MCWHAQTGAGLPSKTLHELLPLAIFRVQQLQKKQLRSCYSQLICSEAHLEGSPRGLY